ncbi:hypothetical protein KR222_002834 [Zaprionus bogoriensis]|nr:hypothetical protein KR222_002834 [Zaprionus bogoriensis]
MHLRSPGCHLWLQLAAAFLLLLQLQSAAAETPSDQTEDRPHVNFDALFRTYIQLGDALFGTWAPKNFEEELQELRNLGY